MDARILEEAKETSYLKEEPYCFACHDTAVVTTLKRCSRCQVAWYCSTQCQKEHFKHHRELCKQIAMEIGFVKMMEVPVQRGAVTSLFDIHDNAVQENFFETRAGEFGRFVETMNYLFACNNRADSYWDAAYDCEIKQVWEKTLFHYLEILRVDVACSDEIRFRAPFILLYLNRDDEAYAVIRYWINLDDYSDYNDEALPRHRRSREGDWLYPTAPHCRFFDIFEECQGVEDQELAMPYMLALIIIKMRIIASHDDIARQVDFAFRRTKGEQIEEIRPVVQEMLIRNDIDCQRQQLDRLFTNIQQDSPSLLHAMLEIEAISHSHGSWKMKDVTWNYPPPVNVTLWYGARLFFRVPGASALLRLQCEGMK